MIQYKMIATLLIYLVLINYLINFMEGYNSFKYKSASRSQVSPTKYESSSKTGISCQNAITPK